MQLQLHYIALHYTTPHDTTLHYFALTTPRGTTTTTLLYTTLGYTTLRYITLHSLLHHKCNCNYTTLITLHHNDNSTTLQLETRTTAAALHHTTSSSCGWRDRPGDLCNHCNHSKKTQFQPPFDHQLQPPFDHQWIRFAIRNSQQPSSYIGFLFLKLPPRLCAVLLVICWRICRPW